MVDNIEKVGLNNRTCATDLVCSPRRGAPTDSLVYLEQVLERGEKIELLVDKTDNLRFQVGARTWVLGSGWRLKGGWGCAREADRAPRHAACAWQRM
jgi:hypothetical protein